MLLLLSSSAPATSRPNILFLMCDSMDGRVVDPSAPLSKLVATPTFDALASDGVNFVRTYASSPQCVPSRASMLSGRRTDQIRAFSNDNGLALSPGGEPDEACVSAYGEAWCRTHGASQALETTLFDELRSGGHAVALSGICSTASDFYEPPCRRV